METRDIVGAIILVILAPLLLYLRQQAYRSTHGNSSLGRDIQSLIQRFRDWRERRKIKRKYKYLDKAK